MARSSGSPRPLRGVSGPERLEEWAGRQYRVRPTPGASATKWYVCPWCDERVAVGEPHVVVWPNDQRGGINERRHWHTRCWRRRR